MIKKLINFKRINHIFKPYDNLFQKGIKINKSHINFYLYYEKIYINYFEYYYLVNLKWKKTNY